MSRSVNILGHAWTVRDLVRRNRLELRNRSVRWWGAVEDPALGRVRLSGWLDQASAERVVVVIHGLGGSADSGYAAEMVDFALAAGFSTLRFSLRGADRSGEDYFHAGLTDDLHAVLASPELASFQDISVIGFSLGGHLALRAATESQLDSRVRAVVAISAPLELAACCQVIDLPSRWLYRRYMLTNLLEIYAEVAKKREVPIPVECLRKVRHFREFDDQVVAPRFGFDSAEDYYARASVGPQLGDLRIPALYVGSVSDPMVPPRCVEPYIDASALLDVRWARSGGHVAFPKDLDLGENGGLGVYAQALAWLNGEIGAASAGRSQGSGRLPYTSPVQDGAGRTD